MNSFYLNQHCIIAYAGTSESVEDVETRAATLRHTRHRSHEMHGFQPLIPCVKHPQIPVLLSGGFLCLGFLLWFAERQQEHHDAQER